MFKFDSNGDIVLVHLPGCCNNNNQCATTGCLMDSNTVIVADSDSDTVIVADSDYDYDSDSDMVIVTDSDSDSDSDSELELDIAQSSAAPPADKTTTAPSAGYFRSVQDTLDDLKSLDDDVKSLNKFVNSPYAHMVDCLPLVNQFDSVRLRVKDIPIHGSFEEQMDMYEYTMDINETISDIGDRIINLVNIRNLGLSVGVYSGKAVLPDEGRVQ